MLTGVSTRAIGDVKVFSTKRACPVCGTSYPELDPRMFSYNSKHGWCADCVGTGMLLTREQRKALDDTLKGDDKGREQTFAEPEVEDVADQPCGTCHGARLNPTSLAIRFRGESIAQVAERAVGDAARWVEGLQLDGREGAISRDLIPEIQSRLEFLQDVGLGYLTLDRAAPTLSGGEAQRIRLAAQLGSNLQGVCYVLDEPTIGLHPRDNQILLDALHKLGAQGNTLVVVEHDEDTIRRADHIIDIGPGAGKRGGTLIAQGTAADLAAHADSITGRFLAKPLVHPLQARREVDPAAPMLTVRGASLHNLRSIDVPVPLHRLVAITGVSGSGKSTLARDVLLANVQAIVASRGKGLPAWGGCSGIEGWERVDRVLEVDQTPIGKTPRSCPATYVGFWDTIRKLFAETLEAKARGYAPARFSFNTGDGRCPGCEGQGMRTIEMNFLPDVKVLCDLCHGQRFSPETLAVTWRGKNIGDVLAMEIDEAVEFFASMPNIAHPLQLMKDVGLGLSHARPALADALGRRGAAHQARHRAEQGARRRDAARAEGAAHAVRARRADGGPAHGRCREAHPRAASPGRRRAQRGGDRARPRRGRRGRLDHRPRARRVASRAGRWWWRARLKRWSRQAATRELRSSPSWRELARGRQDRAALELVKLAAWMPVRIENLTKSQIS